MARVTDASEAWQSFTPANNETIQVQVGDLRISTMETPGEKDGLILRAFGARREDAVQVLSGVEVQYKLAEGCPSAEFVREEI